MSATDVESRPVEDFYPMTLWWTKNIIAFGMIFEIVRYKMSSILIDALEGLHYTKSHEILIADICFLIPVQVSVPVLMHNTNS